MIRSALILLCFACCAFGSEWIDRCVDREFAYYRGSGICKEQIDAVWNEVKERPEFLRYKIISSVVYGPRSRIRNLLEALVRIASVPDVDFIYFYEDRIKKRFVERRPDRYGAPIFVSAKDESLGQFILFSDWLYDVDERGKGWNGVLQVVNENCWRWDWERRVEKLFWRGSPFDGNHFGMYDFENWTAIPRGQLVYQSMRHPDLIDAAFSAYPRKCFEKDPERCVREMGAQSYVSQQDQLQFKYQILVDGVTCTFPGTHWKLLSGSLVFKQESPDIMYFYPELIAWEHYVPVKNDLSDLVEKIQWAKKHDGKAREMAGKAREFALTHLMPDQILAYCYAVLCRYASLQTFRPTLSLDDF